MSVPAIINPATVSQPKPLRVLYADDMQQLRELLVIVLGRDGHAVQTVPSGEDALEKITAEPGAYDVIITDHHMPGMNGLELVGFIRTLPFAGKVIVFSSELSPAVDAAYHRLNVDHILPKPIFPAQLRAVFASL